VFLGSSLLLERSLGWAIWVLIPAVLLVAVGFVSIMVWASGRGRTRDPRAFWNPFSRQRAQEFTRQTAGEFVPRSLLAASLTAFAAAWLVGVTSMMLLPRNGDRDSGCFFTHGFLSNPCAPGAQAAASERLAIAVAAAFLTGVVLHAVGAYFEIRAWRMGAPIRDLTGEPSLDSFLGGPTPPDTEAHDSLRTSVVGMWHDLFGRNLAAGVAATLAPIGFLLTVSVLFVPAGLVVDLAAVAVAAVGLLNRGNRRTSVCLIALGVAAVGAGYATLLLVIGT
jgi:hypothetical protein